jgi:hypothetical protein
MKHSRLLIFCFIFFPLLLPAQKMISIGNLWNINFYGDFSGHGRANTLFFFKDSLKINGQYYFQLYRDNDSTFNKPIPTRKYYREKAGIVSRWDSTLNKDMIVYNFNLNINDTFPIRNRAIKVLNIDTIQLFDNVKRKRLTFYHPQYGTNPYSLTYWIEGIGGLSEPFHPEVTYLTTSGSSLNCFFSNGKYVYGYDKEGCKRRPGLIIIDKATEIKELVGFQLLNNSGDGNIAFRLETPGRYQCQVFDATGRRLQSPPVSQGVNKVSLTDAPKGIYILHIYDLENQQQMGLKVVRH